MRRISMAIVSATSLALAGLTAATPAANAAQPVKLECDCKQYSGGDVCYSYLNIDGRTLSFGAFETSGDGRLRVKSYAGHPVYWSKIKTSTGQRMTVYAYLPRGLKDVEVSLDTFTPGKWTFLMSCK